MAIKSAVMFTAVGWQKSAGPHTEHCCYNEPDTSCSCSSSNIGACH